VRDLGTDSDLGVILEVFSGMPSQEQKPDEQSPI